MNIQKRKTNKGGFTLVEIMVSVAIFSMVITAGMGSLMTVLSSYRHAKREKKAADAISYVLENMTREMRLGDHYYAAPDNLDNALPNSVNNGSFEVDSGKPLIGFNLSDHRGYVIYYLENEMIKKKQFYPNGDVRNGTLSDSQQIKIPEARVTVMNTGDDKRQPLVWLQLKVQIPGSDKVRVIQTLVSQRALDVY